MTRVCLAPLDPRQAASGGIAQPAVGRSRYRPRFCSVKCGSPALQPAWPEACLAFWNIGGAFGVAVAHKQSAMRPAHGYAQPARPPPCPRQHRRPYPEAHRSSLSALHYGARDNRKPRADNGGSARGYLAVGGLSTVPVWPIGWSAVLYIYTSPSLGRMSASAAFRVVWANAQPAWWRDAEVVGVRRSACADRAVSQARPVMMLARWNSPPRLMSLGDWPKPALARAMVVSMVTAVPAL